jgi:hypothetical protein
MTEKVKKAKNTEGGKFSRLVVLKIWLFENYVLFLRFEIAAMLLKKWIFMQPPLEPIA